MVIPFLGSTLGGTAVDWNLTSSPQPGLGGRSIPYSRGLVLGGSSSTSKHLRHMQLPLNRLNAFLRRPIGLESWIQRLV